MEVDPKEAKRRRRMLALEEKIRKSDEIIKTEMQKKIINVRNLKRTENKLSMSKNPAYGPSFLKEGTGIKKTTHQRMVAQIKSITLPTAFRVNKKLIASNHNSMNQSIVFSTDGRSFVTTCRGGRMNLWDAASQEEDPQIISTLNASAEGKQRWPEDVAFFPNEDRLVAVYKNANVDQQVALVTFSRQNEAENSVQFLTHENMGDLVIKGGVRRVLSIQDTDTTRFITAGEDKSIVVWGFGDEVTRYLCHRTWHTNDVNGICGVKNKAVIVSAGLDKRVIGYDLIEHKKVSSLTAKGPCLGILSNPVNPDLLLIHTRTVENQLTLYDHRKKETVCEFGWKQTHTQAQSELISPSWAPSGWLVSSGSPDKNIHLFDIRVNRRDPAQTIQHAHTRRVLKAPWHPRRSMLVSISSDFLLGIHDLNV